MKSLIFTLLVSFCLAAQSSDSINWYEDLEKAMKEAKSANKPLFLDFFAEWCGPCKRMDRQSYPDSTVVRHMQNFIAVRIDVDKHEQLALKYKGNARKYGGNGIPAMIVVDNENNELYRHHGFLSAKELVGDLAKLIEKHKLKGSEK